MPAQQIEIKFTSILTQAFHLLRCATQQSGPVVALFPSREQIEEIFPLLQSLIAADGHDSESKQPIDLNIWSAWEHSPFSPVSSSITQRLDRLKVLNRPHGIILASTDSWIQPTLPKPLYEKLKTVFELNEDAGMRDELIAELHSLGYTKTETVDEPGQYALRGEILDIFVPTEDHPYRIEFFDTVIEQIRFFNQSNQRTLKTEKPIVRIEVSPAEEVIFPFQNPGPVLERIKEFSDLHQISRKVRDPIFENIRNGFLPDNFRTWIPFVYEKCGYLADYLPNSTQVICFEPEQIEINLKQILAALPKEEEKYKGSYWISPTFEMLYSESEKLIQAVLQSADKVIRVAPLSSSAKPPLAADVLQTNDSIQERKVTEKEVYEWLDDGFFVWVGTRGITHQERLKFLLKRVQNYPGFKILNYDSGESVQFLTEKTVILSEAAFFGKSHAPSKKVQRVESKHGIDDNDLAQFSHVSDLAVGDFVVHALHGVGKYQGLFELPPPSKGEYLLIEYSGGDRLYLPVYRLNTIQKFVGAGGNPSVDKLGTQQFEKAKQKARESAKKLAINLIEIYARRALLTGPKFEQRDQDYFDFCDEFEFTETEGQLKSTEDVLQDLEQGKLLDRLVCGDVGFGKTEVAMRAAFQAVQSGYQVALLVPTTLLAFQHEQSFKKRMKNFPIRIESLSRFKTKKQANELVRALGEGQVDIMIGTHRLISKDVKWNRLGLLIIDEEHRFGVEHKEKIKAIQANTHSLTLTATPIPRTLNMAIAGLKDISIIKTPPTNRQPIKTFVSPDAEELIKTAIETELARGGQIFYLYNKVATIQKKAEDIQKLVPHARIVVAHGQMSEDEIESKMLEFYQGHAQIMVCTTIIESGIDVPNAGTIIIHRADTLGLAQLYQIRGRVGRSHRKAYAYLLVDEERTLTNEAKMRLDVLQRFVELGAGFQIASYDLEIRGGGNFLGGEQSGHIASVGMDLFTELLEEEIQKIRGQKNDGEPAEESFEEKHFEPEIQVPVRAEINPELVPDPKLRLSLYRKLSNARSNKQVDAIYEEMLDRFGKIPESTENLFWLIRLKNLLKRVGIEAISVSPTRTSLTVRKVTQVDVGETMMLYMGPKNIRDTRVSITPDSKIVLTINFSSLQSHLFELEALFKKIAPKAFENPKIAG